MLDAKEMCILQDRETLALSSNKWGFKPLTGINGPTSARPKSYTVVGVIVPCCRFHIFSTLVWKNSKD